jgi:hypothetical protein
MVKELIWELFKLTTAPTPFQTDGHTGICAPEDMGPRPIQILNLVPPTNFRWRRNRVTGRLKTGHSRALQNRPLQGGLFISFLLVQSSDFGGSGLV